MPGRVSRVAARSVISRQAGRFGVELPPAVSSDSNTTIKIFRSIHEIDEKSWNTIVGSNSLLRTHNYLAAIEASDVEHCKYYYPTLQNSDGNIVAHACVYIIDTDLAQLLPKVLQWIPAITRKIWSRFLVVRITECASPLSTSHSISVAPTIDRPAHIKRLADAIDEIARTERSKLLVIRDFLAADRADFDVLTDNGYNIVSNMPVARIRVRWDTYAEYLSSMRARYRKDVKRRLKRALASGQRVRVLDRFSENSRLWVEQARTVHEKTKGFKREVLPVGYYESMDRFLGDKSLLVVADRDGEIVAHGMLLKDDCTTIATYFGRNLGPAHQEWFHLVNEVIRIGIENKSDYINLGLGSYDAKSNVGADVEPLFVYSKSTIGAVNWLMRRVPRTMDHPIAEPKQVFKQDP